MQMFSCLGQYICNCAFDECLTRKLMPNASLDLANLVIVAIANVIYLLLCISLGTFATWESFYIIPITLIWDQENKTHVYYDIVWILIVYLKGMLSYSYKSRKKTKVIAYVSLERKRGKKKERHLRKKNGDRSKWVRFGSTDRV